MAWASGGTPRASRGRSRADGELAHDAGGARRQHVDAVRQADRLAHVVGDRAASSSGWSATCSSSQRCIPVRVSASSAPNGSSSSSMPPLLHDGAQAAPRAGACRRRAGPDSAARSRRGRTRKERRDAVPARARRVMPCTSSPSVALSMIRRHGISASRCGMKAKRPSHASSGRAVEARSRRGRAGSAPVSSRNSVDLPAPDGPRIETNSPASTWSEMPAEHLRCPRSLCDCRQREPGIGSSPRPRAARHGMARRWRSAVTAEQHQRQRRADQTAASTRSGRKLFLALSM